MVLAPSKAGGTDQIIEEAFHSRDWVVDQILSGVPSCRGMGKGVDGLGTWDTGEGGLLQVTEKER